MATAQQARPETHGSRTQMIAQTPAVEAGPSEPPAIPPAGVLKLRGGPSRKARVEWSEEVVDNEGMGRKKSKICCIYTKPRAFDESSSESGSGSEDEHDHNHSGRMGGKDGADKGKGKAVRRKVDGTGAEVEEGSGEESESDGGAGDGRARPARRPNRRRHRHHHDHDHDHGPDCGGHAAKLNKYDAEPRRAAKPQPPPTS